MAKFQVVSLISLLVLVASCTSTGLRRYETLLDPELGRADRLKIDRLLGQPAHCEPPLHGRIQCEYRTPYGRNQQVNAVLTKQPGMGPDLSPYDQFDVLHLIFDELGVLRDWEAVVIH